MPNTENSPETHTFTSFTRRHAARLATLAQRPIVRRAMRWVGLGLVLASLGLLGAAAVAQWDNVVAAMASGPAALATLGGAFIYGASVAVLAAGFGALLRGLGGGLVEQRPLFALYAEANILKYLPGNVFHLVGRQAMAHRLGVGQMVMAGASVAEAGLTVCAAVLISGILGLGAVLDALPSGTSFSVVLAAVGGCVAIPVGLVAFGPRLLALRGGATGNRRSIARGLLHAFVLHLVFFSLMGLTGWGIITVASNGLNTAGIAEVAGAVALSWLAGFILPGASAGLGVREATLFLLLSGSMGDATSLALAVLLRVATTLGDGVFFLAALALRDRKTPTEAAPEHNRSNA